MSLDPLIIQTLCNYLSPSAAIVTNHEDHLYQYGTCSIAYYMYGTSYM